MSAHRLLLLFVLLVHSSLAAAGNYAITGRVTRADGQTPIADAEVGLYRPGWIIPVLIVRTWTDANGNYALSGDCEAGCYVSAYRAPYFGAAQTLASPGTITLNFALQSPATIRGQVRHASAGVTPIAVEACRDIGGGDYAACDSASTDANGDYVVDGLLPGNYRVCTVNAAALTLRMQCYEQQDAPALAGLQQFDVVVLGDGETRTAVDFDLVQGATIAGQIRDALTGQPVAGEIEVYDENGDLLSVFAADGDYRTGGLAPGTYYVRATTQFNLPFFVPVGHLHGGGPCNTGCVITSGTAITLDPAQAVTGIDFPIAPLATLHGVVRDAQTQQPLEGVRVRQMRLIGISIPSNLETTTAADGSYAFYASPNASVRLHAAGTNQHVGVVWPDLPCPSSCDFVGTSFVVPAGDSIRDFNLVVGGTIAGQVVQTTP
ncbi:MAG TPA: hypothetical protein VLF18_10235, partial [Tahibacter sp.]|uniref:MSCRAMM family protein n=1 Tax=Tahibacter sp. TaxID=2056211 RepID=UPI002CD482A6